MNCVKKRILLVSTLYFICFSYSAYAYEIRGHTEIILLYLYSKELDIALFKFLLSGSLCAIHA